ncbi:hypothetical protein Kfla_1137 [Kribbella flavida DSM 17836]|uniref:Uncharacterized protein n=1 Tax=Kribbella flavida (strain DSM 17836 / JCM 10339 / NBRC 14399) TaxID=479435 RepID=D2Q2R0_KRIFD|nr:hypothetical protein [Kribbella flavida]ADB30241.1 hypothetical protein Kfla_1137 [Kribbella flavida DSM 17836]
MSSNPQQTTARTLGLPVWALVGLALLAAPRVVLHDLGLATNGPLAGLLALGPAAVWIAVAVLARLPRPWVSLLVVGVFYGCFLAIGHNIFWDEAFGDSPPRLGGNLDGELSPGTEELLARGATTISSVFTGAAVGLICGLVATVIQRFTTRRS